MSSSPARDREKKIQGYVAPYGKWVLQRLVELGFEGVSVNDAVSNIVQRWLDAHEDEHRQLGITKEAFLRARKVIPAGTTAERGTKAKLFRLDEKRLSITRQLRYSEPRKHVARREQGGPVTGLRAESPGQNAALRQSRGPKGLTAGRNCGIVDPLSPLSEGLGNG